MIQVIQVLILVLVLPLVLVLARLFSAPRGARVTGPLKAMAKQVPVETR